MLRDIEGVRLNVLDEGSGQAVVFLHGLGGCWHDWEPQIETWRTDHRVIVIEHRGHGRSDRAPGPYSTDLFAADALAVLRHLGVDHAHVVGLSMGGMIAHKLAVAAPEVVDTLVLCDTFWRTGSAGQAGLRMVADIVRDNGMGAVNDLFSAQAGDGVGVGDVLSTASGAVQRNNLRDAEGNDPHCWAWAAEAVAAHDMTEDKGQVRVPALVVWGENDVAVPLKLAQPLADAVGADGVVVLEGADHVCNLDAPDAFDAALRAFFAAHPVAPSASPG